MRYINLIDYRWFDDNNIIIKEVRYNGSGEFVTNGKVDRYDRGYVVVSLNENLLNITEENDKAILRMKVLQLHFLNPELYENDPWLFHTAMERINDMIRAGIGEGSYHIRKLVQETLRSVNYTVNILDVGKYREYKVRSNELKGLDYSDALSKSRSLINEFRGELKVDYNQGVISDAVDSIIDETRWVSTSSISDKLSTTEVFNPKAEKVISVRTVRHYISGFRDKIDNYHKHVFGTVSFAKFETDRKISKVIDLLGEDQQDVKVSELVQITGLSRSTIYDYFKYKEQKAAISEVR